MSPAENSEAIEIPFAFRTPVGPGKHRLHIADRFEANNVLCLFNRVQSSGFGTVGVRHSMQAQSLSCPEYTTSVKA